MKQIVPSPVSPSRRLVVRVDASSAVLCLTAVVVAGLLISRAGYDPIWDGRIYADCIAEAARRFSLGALRCAEHPSHAYVAVAALAQSLEPGSFPILLATNAALFAVACFGFHRIL